ncbi:MAG: hypothetical protein E6I22_05580 [Chloroflexi bacterium]|nr:MAG: hypothetical protein E6I22_05580 [Chloroflexota bacterium]TMG40485.1 MAG: hypothetical protein E6H92_02740 [Chloroflexota bacterium]
MPGNLVNTSAQVMCAHGGQAQATMPNTQVQVGGSPTVTLAAPWTIAGCANPPPPAQLGPCVTATWIPGTGTVRVTSNGMPLLVQSSQSLCVPTPAPLIISNAGQTKVTAM